VSQELWLGLDNSWSQNAGCKKQNSRGLTLPLDSAGEAAAEVLRHAVSIFTQLDSKLSKLRGVSPLLSIALDMNFIKKD